MTSRGKRFEYAMRLRGFHKQHALAHLLGVTESTITRWKNSQAISVDHAVAFCTALDISLDWFLRGIGPIDAPIHDTYAVDMASARSGVEETAPVWLLSREHLAQRARYNH